MEIYLIGYIVVPLGILYFFYSPTKLDELTIFSIPFTGTAIFQISYSEFRIEGIRASMFLGSLCLLRHFIYIFNSKQFRISKRLGLLILMIFMLGLTCFLSLVMPILIDGKLSVLDAYSRLLTYAEPKPLYFKLQYISQTAYFLFGCLLACYFAMKNESEAKIQRSIQIYLYATLFVCCWGLLEFILFYAHITYPAFLFNANENAMNHAGPSVLDGRVRVISVSLEPSILSQQLLTALPLIFWPMLEKARYLKTIKLRRLCFLVVAILVLSLSTTAIVGIALFSLIVLLHYLGKKKINIYLFYGLAVGMILLIFSIPFLIQELGEKVTTFSGAERIKAIKYGWYYFTQYPILGIGWGVFPSYDFFVCILTGMGILGLLLFLLLLYLLYLNFRNLNIGQKSTTLTKSVGSSLLLLIAISQFSGFIYHSQYFWLILGLAMAASTVTTEAANAKLI